MGGLKGPYIQYIKPGRGWEPSFLSPRVPPPRRGNGISHPPTHSPAKWGCGFGLPPIRLVGRPPLSGGGDGVRQLPVALSLALPRGEPLAPYASPIGKGIRSGVESEWLG